MTVGGISTVRHFSGFAVVVGFPPQISQGDADVAIPSCSWDRKDNTCVGLNPWVVVLFGSV
jgi:hypothetical protein